MAKTGRPSLLTPEITEEICKHRASGLPLETACELVGVLPQTVRGWRQRGEACLAAHQGDIAEALVDEADGWCVAFLRSHARASAEGERMLLGRVLDGGKGSWGAGWTLERVHRDRYSTRSESKVDASVRMDAEGGADADAAAKARALAFLAGAAGGAKDKGDPGTEE